jgi:hypothetical protein
MRREDTWVVGSVRARAAPAGTEAAVACAGRRRRGTGDRCATGASREKASDDLSQTITELRAEVYKFTAPPVAFPPPPLACTAPPTVQQASSLPILTRQVLEVAKALGITPALLRFRRLLGLACYRL